MFRHDHNRYPKSADANSSGTIQPLHSRRQRHGCRQDHHGMCLQHCDSTYGHMHEVPQCHRRLPSPRQHLPEQSRLLVRQPTDPSRARRHCRHPPLHHILQRPSLTRSGLLGLTSHAAAHEPTNHKRERRSPRCRQCPRVPIPRRD